MAASSKMQSILASPLTRVVSNRSTRKEQLESVTTSPPQPTPKVSINFSDLLAFSGPAPERINDRLVMTGFIAAMAVELSNG
ncbi:early light-induced protein, partial [Quercus suber]